MSTIGLILMWSAVLLAPIKIAELLEPIKPHIVPDGDASSLRLEALIMVATLILLALLSALLDSTIEPAGSYTIDALDLLKTPWRPPA